MREKVQKTIFFLIIISLSNQLGKHFWPPFSFVSGIRIDYLSPTIYVSDIFIICLLVVWFFNVFKNKEARQIIQKTKNFKFILLFSILLIPLLYAKSPPALLYGFVKLLEFAFLGHYVSRKLRYQDIAVFSSLLSVNSLFISLIAIAQFLKQGSIGGLLYFWGERTLFASGVGIATFQGPQGQILRPYATFPHPNVLAFFLLFSIVFIFHRFIYTKQFMVKLLLLIAISISLIALFLTFSRIIILCFVLFLFITVWKLFASKKIIRGLLAGLLVVGTIIYFQIFSMRFLESDFIFRDFGYRKELVDIAWSIFRTYPLFGIGIKNFFYHEFLYQKEISPVLLQPVHNIYLLALVETGIAGFIIFILFLAKSFSRLLKRMQNTKNREIKHFYLSVLYLFLAVIFVGFFDHFLLTLQQGQLMLVFILGLAWTRMR